MSIALLGLSRPLLCSSSLCRCSLTKLLQTSNAAKGNLKKPTSLNTKEVNKKINRYVFAKFFDYIKNYDKLLEKRFPTAVQAYRYFLLGVKDFYADMIIYLQVVRKIAGSGKSVACLTRKEMETYFYMPREMRKAAPVLIISSLPLMFYVVLPLAYYMPGHLLTQHFWTMEQKAKYRTDIMKARLKHNRPVLRALQAQLENMKDSRSYEQWREILGMLGSGIQPTPDQILNCKDLFNCGPYSIKNMHVGHIRHLILTHSLHRGFFRRSRLIDHASTLILMDKAIVKEGGVSSLSNKDLIACCILRGLNSSNMSHTHMVKWLEQWISVSNQIDSTKHASLILHCPVLLGYNHPSNWATLYDIN